VRCVYIGASARAHDDSVEIITPPKWHGKEPEKQGEMRTAAESVTTFVTRAARLQRARNRTVNFANV